MHTVVGNPVKLSGGFINGKRQNGEFSEPRGMAMDSTDNPRFYVADTLNHAIRFISNNTVETLAGNGHPGYINDNGNFFFFLIFIRNKSAHFFFCCTIACSYWCHP